MKKVRFSDAADAIEATPKALRKMLQNPSFAIPIEREGAGWTTFTPMQIAVLAISRRLIDLGQPVIEASSWSCAMLLGCLSYHRKLKGNAELSVADFRRVISDEVAALTITEGKRLAHIYRTSDDTTSDLHKRWCKDAMVTLPIGAVVNRAFERAGISDDEVITRRDREMLVEAGARRAAKRDDGEEAA